MMRWSSWRWLSSHTGSGRPHSEATAYGGQTSQIDFKPDQAGSYLIGIDSSQAFNYGGFTLELVETP